MAFKILSFSLASERSNFKIEIAFNTGFFDALLFRKRYAVLFYHTGSHWFQRRPGYPEFICDPVTSEFLDCLRSELTAQYLNLPSPGKTVSKSLNLVYSRYR